MFNDYKVVVSRCLLLIISIALQKAFYYTAVPLSTIPLPGCKMDGSRKLGVASARSLLLCCPSLERITTLTDLSLTTMYSFYITLL